jgi:MFS family permease
MATTSTTARDPRRWWALALLCGAFFMVILDAAIVTVALPSIEKELDFSAQGLQWVVSAYALTFAGLLLLGGRAADLLGRRRVFMFGVVVFTLASLLCGLAWSDTALIGARAFQGVGAAIMTPSALSIITTTFEEGAERNKALGIWGALGGIGATTAWLIGGPSSTASAGSGSSSSTSPSASSHSRSLRFFCVRARRQWLGEATTPPVH